MTKWEINDGTEQAAPLNEEQVVARIGAGLPATTQIRPAGSEEWRALRSHAPFARALDSHGVPAKGKQPSPLVIGFVSVGMLSVIFLFASNYNPHHDSPPTSGYIPPPPSPVEKPVENSANPLDVVMAKTTVRDAMKATVPLMVDRFDDSSPGTFLFALWSLQHLAWKDVAVTTDETSYGKALKDLDAERAKRLCVAGSIIEIGAHKQPYGTLYVGLLVNDALNLYHFNAVKSSGDLVAQSSARFCGFVTGAYDYSNSAGGSGHALDMVGIFDLPANRR